MKSADKFWYFIVARTKKSEESWPHIYSYSGTTILEYLQFNEDIRVYRTPKPHTVKKLMILDKKNFAIQIPDEFRTEIYAQNFITRESECYLHRTRRMPAPKKYPDPDFPTEHLED